MTERDGRNARRGAGMVDVPTSDAGRRRFAITTFASLALTGTAGCVEDAHAQANARDAASPRASHDAGRPDANAAPAPVRAGGGRMGGGEGTIGLGSIGTIGGGGSVGGGVGRIGLGDIGGVRMGSNTMIVPRVRLRPATVTGTLSPEIVRRVVMRNMGQFQYCYTRINADGGALPAGSGEVAFVIGPMGQVLSSTPQAPSSPALAPVLACIAASVQRFQFPAPEGGGVVTVRYPLAFDPGPS